MCTTKQRKFHFVLQIYISQSKTELHPRNVPPWNIVIGYVTQFPRKNQRKNHEYPPKILTLIPYINFDNVISTALQTSKYIFVFTRTRFFRKTEVLEEKRGGSDSGA